MEPRPSICWISVGSNRADPMRQLAKAHKALDALPNSRILWTSAIFRSAPVGGVEQAYFLNSTVRLETRLDAEVLLDALLAIEAQAGRDRRREVYWGPRSLDLDLLLYDQRIQTHPRLTLPHPRMHQRAFVLLPLAEFDRQLAIPGRGTVADWLPRVADQEIERLEEDSLCQPNPVTAGFCPG